MSTYSGREAALARARAQRVEPSADEVMADFVAELHAAQYDGGAWMLAPGDIEQGGTTPAHWAFVASVVAQPADVRMMRRRSVIWRGDGMASRDGDGTGGRLVDTGHHARRHAIAADTPDGYNGTHNGTPVRWRPLTAAGAVWLHAVADTLPSEQLLKVWINEPRRVVGAIEVAPRVTRVRHAVAVDWQVRENGTTHTRTTYEQPSWERTSTTYSAAWQEDASARPLHGTARWARVGREDGRTGDAVTPERRAGNREVQRARRAEQARQAAAAALAAGTVEALHPRATARKLAEGAAVVAALSAGTVTPRAVALCSTD